MTTRIALLAALTLLALAAPAAAAPNEAPRTIAEGLNTAWEIVPVPGGRTFVTEINGRVRVLQPPEDRLQATSIFTDTSGVEVEKFLGLALHPDFPTHRFVYLYETYTVGPTSRSRILRLADDGTRLTLDRVVFDGIGSDRRHDGGRIAFGPDGKLYVTTGDIHDPALPQDLTSLNGKILRLNDDGTAPSDNPFNDGDLVVENADYVWSYGHRHPQGLAWDGDGLLWETEHGPSGEGHAPSSATRGHDELNLIVPGGNYGWPQAAGDLDHPTDPAAKKPVVHSGPAPAWAPGDLAWSATDGLLYAPALNGRHLHVFVPDGSGGIARHGQIFPNTFGRMRVAVAVPGALWLATDASRSTHAFGGCVMRVALDASTWMVGDASPSGAETSCRRSPPPVTTTTTPVADPSPILSPAIETVLPPAPDPRIAAARRLADRLAARLRERGLRKLLRLGSAGVRLGGLRSLMGTSTLLVHLRRDGGRPPLMVAAGTVRTRDGAPVTARVTLTRAGRAALRNRTRVTLLVRVGHIAGGRPAIERRATVAVRRAAR